MINQIVIDNDQIQQIVDRLIEARVSTCDRAPRATIEKAVCQWLTAHIESIVEDADWWVRKEADLHKYGLPYEDEIELSRLEEIIAKVGISKNKLKLPEPPQDEIVKL